MCACAASIEVLGLQMGVPGRSQSLDSQACVQIARMNIGSLNNSSRQSTSYPRVDQDGDSRSANAECRNRRSESRREEFLQAGVLWRIPLGTPGDLERI